MHHGTHSFHEFPIAFAVQAANRTPSPVWPQPIFSFFSTIPEEWNFWNSLKALYTALGLASCGKPDQKHLEDDSNVPVFFFYPTICENISLHVISSQ